MLDVPRELIRFVVGLLRVERKARGTRTGTRRLTCEKQALFAVAWFRDKPNITRHGAAFGLPQSTAYRYLHEAIDVLADQAPDLHQALEKAVADGLPHLELDGKIFATDRCRQKTVSVKGETIDAWFSGKTSGFGGNGQALCEPNGFPIWTSDVLAVDNRCHNALQRSLRCLGERGFALLTERWTTLKHTTLSPGRLGDLVRAAHVLTLFENRRIN